MHAPRTSVRRPSRKQEVHGVDRACLHKATWLAVAQTGEPRCDGFGQSLGRSRRDKKRDAFVSLGLGNADAMPNLIFFTNYCSRG